MNSISSTGDLTDAYSFEYRGSDAESDTTAPWTLTPSESADEPAAETAGPMPQPARPIPQPPEPPGGTNMLEGGGSDACDGDPTPCVLEPGGAAVSLSASLSALPLRSTPPFSCRLRSLRSHALMTADPPRPLEARAHSAAHMSGLQPLGGQASCHSCTPTLFTPSSSAQSRRVAGPLATSRPDGLRSRSRRVRDLSPSGNVSITSSRCSRAGSSFAWRSPIQAGRSMYEPRFLRAQKPGGRSEYQLLSADQVGCSPR
jgi:hypothetical protein